MAPIEPVAASETTVARAKPGEPAGAPLARARVFRAMFGDQSAVAGFGRFRVIGRLGAGGMGVVYEAYDPDLARGVALKLVNVAAGTREAALAEAKALARLSHPHVVPIYDVGFERDHVYLVMELVRGQTLRAWAPGRSVRAIVTVYHQAALALAAAHDVGLVHRDFKPDNAIVGNDRRVRVVDFGLACEADDPAREAGGPRRVAGTPGFMAPEIEGGMAITPAADQYSFCVALGEALAGAADPVPRRLIAAIERGRAPAPADRFASMHDLARAIMRDPARTWRRFAAAAAAAVVVSAAAFGFGRSQSEGPVCDNGAARIAAVWPAVTQATALDRISALGARGQSLRPLLERGLADHAARWIAGYEAACRDRRRGAETDMMSERRTTCLRRSSDARAAVGELIAGEGDLAALARAVQSIPDPAACSNRDVLSSDIAPPEGPQVARAAQLRTRLAHAQVLVDAGQFDAGRSAAAAVVAEARTLGYQPLLAEALLVQGHAQMNLADTQAAVPVLAEATRVATSSYADAIAVEAWARRAFVQGGAMAPGDPQAGLEVIEPLAQRTSSAAFARALLYNNLGSVELGRDHRAVAHDYFERALAESRKVAGRGALELVVIRANLAISTADHAQADALLADAAAELADRLGADHPDTRQLQRLRGTATIENLGAAADLLEPVCKADAVNASLVNRGSACWVEVGLLRADLGDRDRAVEAMREASRAHEPAGQALGYLALFSGDPRTAAKLFAERLATNAPAQGEARYLRLVRAQLALGLGRARRELGDLRGARDSLEAAIPVLEDAVREHPVANIERRLGRARVELAFTLLALHDRASDQAAAAAAAWLRRAGGSGDELARLERIRAEPTTDGPSRDTLPGVRGR